MKAAKKCIICDGDDVKLLYEPLGIVGCTSCGLTYRDTITIEEGYYADLEKYRQSVQDPVKMAARRRDAKQRFDILERIFAVKGSLLDIGANDGLSMLEAKRRGFSVLGCEPNMYAAQHAKNAGLEILQKPFEEAFEELQKRGPFDVVTIFHVLEHFSDPLSTLTMIKRILSPDARLAIEVPNIDSPVSRIYRWDDLRINKEHLFYFNKKTLYLLLIKAGFRPIASRSRVWDGLNRPFLENLIRFNGISWMYSALRKVKRGLTYILGIKHAQRQTREDNLELWIKKGAGGGEKKYFLSGLLGKAIFRLNRGDDALVVSKANET